MFSNNVMASHYHPGAYGKAVQGEWSCCRKGKTAQGCCETGFRDRAQSAILFSISNDEAHDYDDDDDDEYDDDDEMNEYSKSLPSNYGLMPTPLHDTASVISIQVHTGDCKGSFSVVASADPNEFVAISCTRCRAHYLRLPILNLFPCI